MTIGERIKKVRKDNKLTQEDLATSIGIRQNSLALLESGKRNPSDITIRSLCNKLHVNEDWLRHGTGDMYAQECPLAELIEQADLCKEDVTLIRAYVKMPKEKRFIFRECLGELLEQRNT